MSEFLPSLNRTTHLQQRPLFLPTPRCVSSRIFPRSIAEHCHHEKSFLNVAPIPSSALSTRWLVITSGGAMRIVCSLGALAREPLLLRPPPPPTPTPLDPP